MGTKASNGLMANNVKLNIGHTEKGINIEWVI